MLPYLFAMHWTARRAASPRLVIPISMMGSTKLQSNISPPCTCENRPSSTHVMQCRRERPSPRVHFTTIHPWIWRIQIKRDTCWSATYGREGRTVSMACVSWTLAPYPTTTSLCRSVSRRQRIIIRRNNWIISSGNATTYPLCSLVRQPPWGRCRDYA